MQLLPKITFSTLRILAYHLLHFHHHHHRRHAQIRTTSARDLLGNPGSESRSEPHADARRSGSKRAASAAAATALELRRDGSGGGIGGGGQQQPHFSYENCTDSAKQTARNGE